MPDLEQKAHAASSVIQPPELHGLVCGFSAACPARFSMSDFVQLAGVDALHDEAATTAFISDTLTEFFADDMSFVPLLPAQDEPLSARLGALSEWCAGFLSGFGAVAAQDTVRGALPLDVQEILKDFSSISALDDEAEGEQDESAFTELYEYVRVAAVLTQTLMLDQNREGAEADPD